MHAPFGQHTPAGDRPRRTDEGSTLILVLLLVVIAGLVVVPLMTYTASVLRLNSAVSERTKDVEAAKAGLRVAMSDPLNVFTECDNGGNLGTLTINGETVTTTCSELDEIGPLEALGYPIPYSAVAMQLGADVPSIAVPADTTLSSADSTAIPVTNDWWRAFSPPVPANEAWDAVTDTVWLPELPVFAEESRSSVPFDMPVGFNGGASVAGPACKVFFPGNYSDPVVLDGSDYYYFASGVYYFADSVTVSENADVVVGQGLEDFESLAQPSACADDLQVADNAVDSPEVFAIGGGGATRRMVMINRKRIMAANGT